MWFENVVFISLFAAIMASQVKLGVVFFEDADFKPQHSKAIHLAVQKLNLNDSILPEVEVSLIEVPISLHNTEIDNLAIASQVLQAHREIVALVGFHYDEAIFDLTLLSDIFRIPIIAGAVINPALSNKEEYPYVTRLVSSGVDTYHAISDISNHVADFKRVAFVGPNSTEGVELADVVRESLEENGIQLIDELFFNDIDNDNPNVFITAIDSLLVSLKEQDTKVIILEAHHESGKMILWRALLLGMLSDSVQWMLSEEMCEDSVFHHCHLDACEEALPAIREVLIGALCLQGDFTVNSEWFENEWKPNTLPELLTVEEIELSETDDWIDDFEPLVVFSYDEIELFGRAFYDLCLLHESGYDYCITHGNEQGDLLMDGLKKVQFEGISGPIQFDDNSDRIMNQQVMEWNGSHFEKKGLWIPERLRKTGIPALILDTPLLFCSQDGKGPSTVEKKGYSNTTFAIGEIVMVAALVLSIFFSIVLLRDNREVKSKAQSFFGRGTVLFVIWWSFGMLVAQIYNSYLSISPKSGVVAVSVILEYIEHIPMTVLMTGLISRIFRFYRITHNKKMSRIKFSKHHQLKWVLYVLGGVFCFSLIRFIIDIGYVKDGKNIFNQVLEIQDENLYQYFTVTVPIYERHDHSAYSSYFHLISSRFILLVSALIGAFLARITSNMNGSRKVQMAIGSEMSSIERCMNLLVAILSVDTIYQLIDEVLGMNEDAFSHDHVGFENGESKMTLGELREGGRIQIYSAILMYICFTTMVFESAILRRIKRCIRGTSLASSTSITGISTSKTHHSSSGKYQLSQELQKRLRFSTTSIAEFSSLGGINDSGLGLNTNGSSSHNPTNFRMHVATSTAGKHGGSSMFTDSNMVLTADESDGTTTAPTSAYPPNEKYVVAGPSSQQRFANSPKIVPLSSLSTLRVPTIEDSSKTRKIDSREKFNAKTFVREIKKMTQEKIIETMVLLEAKILNQSGSASRLLSHLSEVDEKLEEAVMKLEILRVKLIRELPLSRKRSTVQDSTVIAPLSKVVMTPQLSVTQNGISITQQHETHGTTDQSSGGDDDTSQNNPGSQRVISGSQGIVRQCTIHRRGSNFRATGNRESPYNSPIVSSRVISFNSNNAKMRVSSGNRVVSFTRKNRQF